MHGVLLTGFVPFGDFSLNPSQQIAEALHGERIEGHRVESLVLPVEFGPRRRIRAAGSRANTAPSRALTGLGPRVRRASGLSASR